MTLIPPRLKIGDIVGMVTLSARIDDSPSANRRKELENGLNYLK
jgi:hypothetical protein